MGYLIVLACLALYAVDCRAWNIVRPSIDEVSKQQWPSVGVRKIDGIETHNDYADEEQAQLIRWQANNNVNKNSKVVIHRERRNARFVKYIHLRAFNELKRIRGDDLIKTIVKNISPKKLPMKVLLSFFEEAKVIGKLLSDAMNMEEKLLSDSPSPLSLGEKRQFLREKCTKLNSMKDFLRTYMQLFPADQHPKISKTVEKIQKMRMDAVALNQKLYENVTTLVPYEDKKKVFEQLLRIIAEHNKDCGLA